MGNQIFLTVLSLSISGTVTGLLILLFRPVTRKVFSRKWNYYVWLVMTARLILPVSLWINPVGGLFAQLELTGTAQTITAEAEAVSGPKEIQEQGAEEGHKSVQAPKAEAIPEKTDKSENQYHPLSGIGGFGQYLWMLWGLGAVFILCLNVNDYRNFSAYVLADCEEVREGELRKLADELAAKLGIRKRVKIMVSPLITGPVLMGPVNPFIVLPRREQENLDISLVLHHEMIHLKRRDLWYKWLYQMILCVHWFNPLLYLFGQRLNRDCELACDEAVMELLTKEGRKAYGNVLLDAAEQKLKFKRSVLSTTLLEDKGTLKERLKGILHYKKTGKIAAAVSGCVLVLLTGLAVMFGVKNDKTQFTGVSLAGVNFNFLEQVEEAIENALDDLRGFPFDFFDYHDVDDFLAEVSYAPEGKAWQAYDNDELLAGEDFSDYWSAYFYSMYKGSIDCKGLRLSGMDSIGIFYAEKPCTITFQIEAELKSGRGKIVCVDGDGIVTQLCELDEYKNKESVAVSLKEGRNAVKLVGQGARIKELHTGFEGVNQKDITEVYYSEEEETSGKMLGLLQAGDIGENTVRKFMDALPYMKEQEVVRCAEALFRQGVKLSDDELYNLIIYGDWKVGRCLADAVEEGTMEPLTGEAIGELIYYMHSEDVTRLILKMKEDMTYDMLEDFLIYLDEEDKEKCLAFFLEQGNGLSYSEFNEISPYLSSEQLELLDRIGEIRS